MNRESAKGKALLQQAKIDATRSNDSFLAQGISDLLYSFGAPTHYWMHIMVNTLHECTRQGWRQPN